MVEVKVDPIRSQEKIQSMKDILKGQEKYRDLLWFTIGLNTALRISDILDLKVKDVRAEDGSYRNSFQIMEQKTNKSGKHYLNQSIRTALDLFFEHNPSKEQEDYIFTTYSGRLTRTRCHQIIKDLADKVGLEGNYSTHSMRKSYGYHNYREGISLDLLQSKFNHKSSSQTLEYIGITDDDLQKASKSINL